MLQLLLDHIPIRVFWKDRDSIYLGCNSLFAADAGCSSPDDVVGKSDYDMPWKEQADICRAEDSAVANTGMPKLGYEEPQTIADGRIVYERKSKVPLRDEEGQIIGVMGIYEDITDRKNAEEQLRRSEAKYRELVQDANSIIFRWGRDGTIRFVNEFAQAFFGYTEEEIVGQNVIGTIVPETETSGRDLQAMMVEIAAHPEHHTTNVNENMRKNGDRIWVAWTNKPVFDERGDIKELLSVGLDITARIHDQQALQESEARYRSIFNSNVDAFLLFDTDGHIVDANARAGELYGYSRDELIGLCDEDIADPRFCHLFEEFKKLSQGEWFQRESLDIRSDGNRLDVEVHGTRLHYGSNERLLAIVFDVTERNRIRESMKLFMDVAHNMQVGLYVYRLEDLSDDHTLKLTAINPASTIALGLDASDVGRYIDEVLPDLREQGITQRLAEVVRTRVPFSVPDLAFPYTGPPHRHVSLRAFCLPSNQVGVLVANITDLMHAEEEKHKFYRKTIEAATGGKLIICDREEIRQIAGPPIAMYEITRGEELSTVRHAITEIAESEDMDESRVFDTVLCLGEAATNAVKHASGGEVSVHLRDGALLVMVTDNGPGMQALNLPDVALKKGYTTAVSLGMGYKTMISTADQVYLATGPDGTIVASEIRLQATDKPLAEITMPDTW